jgi:hypothetical protein
MKNKHKVVFNRQKKINHLILFFSLLALSITTFTFASMDEAFQSGSQHGTAPENSKRTASYMVLNTDHADLPAYETDKPIESTYAPETLEDKGNEHIENDPLAQKVIDDHDKMEAVGKDPYIDPVAAIARDTIENAEEIIEKAAICLEEKCFDETYEKNQNFADSISEFSVAVEGGNSYSQDKEDQPGWIPERLDPYTVKIYTGKYSACKKSAFDYSNCCDDSGWGNDWGLVNCSTAEKELYEQKQLGLCHTVGTYEEGDWWNKEEIKTHCCFSSKLSRITHEQGRPQIGKSWGSAKSPNCEGFTESEFEQLDFDAMNLSEYEEDIMNSVIPPDPDEFNQNAMDSVKEQAGKAYKEIDL